MSAQPNPQIVLNRINALFQLADIGVFLLSQGFDSNIAASLDYLIAVIRREINSARNVLMYGIALAGIEAGIVKLPPGVSGIGVAVPAQTAAAQLLQQIVAQYTPPPPKYVYYAIYPDGSRNLIGTGSKPYYDGPRVSGAIGYVATDINGTEVWKS